MSPSVVIFGSILVAFLTRVYFVWHSVGEKCGKRKKQIKLKTLFVLGSGGHTAEMINLLQGLDLQRYSSRVYVAAATDHMSLSKAKIFEEQKLSKASYISIYRSREVGQSYVSSVWTTLRAMIHAIFIVFSVKPNVIFCNGPGTCLPICLAGFLLRVVLWRPVNLIYVESVARVQKLSLTGIILHKLGIVDKFYVQWPGLVEKYKGTEFIGRLM